MISVGIPKESKPLEKRVGLTPAGVRHLSKQGISVFVEAGAGRESGFQDADYEGAGAEMVSGPRPLYANAGLLQKVKEPTAAECDLLREDQILFCFLHLASPQNCTLLKTLLKARITSIGYETVALAGKTPLLRPMSEIAGALAAAYAAMFREKISLEGGRRLPSPLLEKLSEVASLYPSPPALKKMGRVVIFGGGVAGQKAMEFSLQMGGEVTVVEKDHVRRESLQRTCKRDGLNLRVVAPEFELRPLLEKAEILIGCVHQPGRRAARVIDRATLESISAQQKKVMMDVAVDQGGNFPQTHATTYEDPVYFDSWGNLRFAVTNIPSLCGRGASEALTEATSPYTAAMARDFEKALARFPELGPSVNTRGGEILIPAIREAHKL